MIFFSSRGATYPTCGEEGSPSVVSASVERCWREAPASGREGGGPMPSHFEVEWGGIANEGEWREGFKEGEDGGGSRGEKKP